MARPTIRDRLMDMEMYAQLRDAFPDLQEADVSSICDLLVKEIRERLSNDQKDCRTCGYILGTTEACPECQYYQEETESNSENSENFEDPRDSPSFQSETQICEICDDSHPTSYCVALTNYLQNEAAQSQNDGEIIYREFAQPVYGDDFVDDGDDSIDEGDDSTVDYF